MLAIGNADMVVPYRESVSFNIMQLRVRCQKLL